jgi:hypothetical protein
MFRWFLTTKYPAALHQITARQRNTKMECLYVKVPAMFSLSLLTKACYSNLYLVLNVYSLYQETTYKSEISVTVKKRT